MLVFLSVKTEKKFSSPKASSLAEFGDGAPACIRRWCRSHSCRFHTFFVGVICSSVIDGVEADIVLDNIVWKNDFLCLVDEFFVNICYDDAFRFVFKAGTDDYTCAHGPQLVKIKMLLSSFGPVA